MWKNKDSRRPSISKDATHFVKLIPRWLAATEGIEIPLGIEVEEARRRALELRSLLREEKITAADLQLDDDTVDVLWQLCCLLTQPENESGLTLLKDASNAYELISRIAWPVDDFGERLEMLRQCALAALRNASREGREGEAEQWRKRRSEAALADTALRAEAELVLATPIPERAGKGTELQLENPELLLALCGLLYGSTEASPASVRDNADFLFHFLLKPRRKIGEYDEREHFLGELALTAGGACRFLSRREEARLWFDRAEMWFSYDTLSRANILRLAYQKLALRLEERQFAEVLSLTPPLIERMTALGMRDEALKARFLEAIVLKETGRLDTAGERLRQLAGEAQACGNGKLLGSAYVSLLQIHAFLGEAEKALDLAREATPILRRLNNRIDLAKLQWGLATLLQNQGKFTEALNAYRLTQKEFSEIEMRADVAAIHLVVADLLLELGQDRQARWEIQAALPVIDEYKLVPERVAALSLLRQSLHNHRINRQALRDLHGHFGRQD